MTQEGNDEANDFNEDFGSEDETVWGFDGTIPFDDGEENNWGDVQIFAFNRYNGEAFNNRESMVYGAHWGRNTHTVKGVQANPMTWGIEIDVQSGEFDANGGNEQFDTSGSIIEG